MKKLILIFAIFAFGISQLFAQQTVTGMVTGDDGNGMPGVTVQVKGTTEATMTASDGTYSIEVPDDSNVLMFTYVGMKTQEVEISGDVINVIMTVEDSTIEEVIIVGYATKGKNSITGSTIQIKADDIKNAPVLSVDQALQGKVAGLAISTTSGSPGSVQDIRIRGAGSLTAGNNPLIVLNGVPISNPNLSAMINSDNTMSGTSLSALASINSADIESITILKDASATSAYGARGSNGVIVITTKQGKNNKTTFNVSTSYTIQNKAVKGYDVLTGAQQEELLYESINNQFGVPIEAAHGFATNALRIAGALNNWIDEGRRTEKWEDAVTRKNAPMYNFDISAMGGNKVSTFYTSLGYNKTHSTIIGSNFRRINASLNYSRNFGDRVKFSTSNSYSNIFQDGLALEQDAYFANPVLAKYFITEWNQPHNLDGTPYIGLSPTFNWLYLKDNDIQHNKMNRFISNSFLEVKILKGLKFKSLVGIDYTTLNYKSYNNKVHGGGQDTEGTSVKSSRRNFNIVYQNSLSYNLTINKHYLSVMGLIEYSKYNNDYLYAYGEKFAVARLTNINSASANYQSNSTFENSMNASYLGMINYEYSNKYILDLTYRREGSSKFAEDNRFGNFWSVGAAWNINKESFMKDVSFISNLRLRASYGVSGNSDINLNQYQALYGYNVNYNGSGAAYASSYGSPDLTWEKNKNYDIGMDFGFLSNKINGSFAYFNKTTHDLLLNVPISVTSGHKEKILNIGEVVNKGIEIILNVDIIRKKEMHLGLSVNFATLYNEVEILAKDPLTGEDLNIEDIHSKTAVGQPIRAWYLRKWAGVNVANGKPLWYINGSEGAVTESYSEAQSAYQGGSPFPKYTGGASLHFDYKGIFFDVSVYFAGGHKVFETWSNLTHHDGLHVAFATAAVAEMMNRWQQPGNVTGVPIINTFHTNSASEPSTRFLYDGDYMRVKNISLGYSLPKAWVSKLKFTDVSIYVRGGNLFTWVKDKRLKYDPETRADGLTRLTNPPTSTISFGLNLKF